MVTQTIIDSTVMHKIATCGSVVVIYQITDLTQRCVREVDRALATASNGWSRPVGVIVFIADTCKPPPSEIRRALANLYNDPSQPVSAVGIVIEASGFIGAALRAFTTGICALAKVHSKPFSTTQDAVNFVTSHMKDAPDVSVNAILTCMDKLRADVAPSSREQASS